MSHIGEVPDAMCRIDDFVTAENGNLKHCTPALQHPHES